MDPSDFRSFTRINLLGKRPRASQPSTSIPHAIPYSSTIPGPTTNANMLYSYSSLFSKPQPTSDPRLLIRFYDPALLAPDARGRTLPDILAWEDPRLEGCHNYIQMLFPLPEGSPFNFDAPVVDREVFEAFRSREELRNGLRSSFERMLAFYGFELKIGGAPVETDGRAEDEEEDEGEASGVRVVKGPNYREAFGNWVLKFDHNHLRISRILRSLRVLGLPDEAQAFFHALRDVFDASGRISERSLMFWRRAAERPLWIAPDDERVLWLKGFEEFEEREKAKKTAVEKDDGGNEAMEEDQEQAEAAKKDAVDGGLKEAERDEVKRKIQKLDEVARADAKDDGAKGFPVNETRNMNQERAEIEDDDAGEIMVEKKMEKEKEEPASRVE